MEMKHYLCQIIVLLNLIWNCLAQLSPEECRLKGYTSNLICSSCQGIARFNLQLLEDDCQKCCKQDESNVIVKYPSAVLDVCKCKIMHFPQVQAFIDSDTVNDWPGLEIKYNTRGLGPLIRLLDKEGEIVKVVNIEKWNTNTIVEFLNEHVEKHPD